MRGHFHWCPKATKASGQVETPAHQPLSLPAVGGAHKVWAALLLLPGWKYAAIWDIKHITFMNLLKKKSD
jgi:hypothetical protein